MADWIPQADTYSTEGPTCPHCGRVYTPDESHYFDESGYTQDECDGCGKPFTVAVCISTSWTCEVIDTDSSRSQEPKDA